MGEQMTQRWPRSLVLGLFTLLLVGCSFVPARGAQAQERLAPVQQPAGIRVEGLAVGFQPGGSLGFSLRETTIAEQLLRRDQAGERGMLWSA